MAVNDPASTWAAYAIERARVADMVSGRDAAVQYITEKDWPEGDDLEMARARAYFLPIVGRTQEAFSGLVFVKAPTRTFPDGFEALTDDVTQTGQEVDRFAEASFDGVMQSGAIAVLVDREPQPEGMTVAEAEAEGFRPFLRLYDATTILEARPAKIGGAMRLARVRLLEVEEYEDPTPDDPYHVGYRLLVRVLLLGDDLRYSVVVWRKLDDRWTQDDPIVPLRDGAPLDHIPIYFATTRDGEPRCDKPPLSDLADLNISHLLNSSDHEWALRLLGRPTIFGAGFEAKEEIAIGSSTAVIAKNPQAKLNIVEASADSVGALREAMREKERHAAAMGARMLAEETKQGIAEQTARIQRAGEASVVGAAANAVSQCLTNALKELAEWGGFPTEVTLPAVEGQVAQTTELLYWLNTDLLNTKLSPEEVKAILDAWVRGALNKADVFTLFQASSLIDPAKSFADHEEQAASEAPPEPTEAELMAAAGGAIGAGQPPPDGP